MSKVLLVGAAACAIATGWGAVAQAQTAPASSKSTAVGEVVVTAERREASAQKVSIALTVLSGKNLQKEGVTTVNDLANASPNLEVEPAFGGGQPQFRIRGVGFQDYASNNAPTVGVYVNEVAYPIPIMTQGAFFDVSRIEVLRGPQGTLYGRNTTGGAVNVITNQPTSTYHSGFDAEYSSYNNTHLEGYVSGPIAQDLTARLAAFTDQGGAYQFNEVTGQKFGNADKFGERLLLDWTPTAKFTAKFEFHAAQDHSDGDALYIFQSTNPAVGAPLYQKSANRFATDWSIDPFFAKDIGVSDNAAPFRHNDSWGVSLNTSYDLGGANLSNIISYDYLNRHEFQDWAPGPIPTADSYFHSVPQVVSDELRLTSNGNGPLSWITGLYYSHQDLNEEYASDFYDVYGVAGEVFYDQKVDSIAGFGQADYKVTDQIDLIGGLRLEHETRAMDDFHNQYLAGAFVIPQVPPTNVSTSMTPLTGKVAAEYRPMTDLMLYVSVSKGVKSGGFTAYNTGTVQGISPFKPETLWAYEGGFKWTLPDRVHFDVSAFHYDYTDEQVLGAIGGAGGTIIGHFVNAPKSHIDGVEGELSGEILPHLNVSQQLGYKIGTYDSFPNYQIPGTLTTISLSGTKIPFPQFSYEGDVSYWVPVTDGYKLEGDINYSYHDTYPSWLDRINPGVSYKLPSYWLANLNLTLSPVHGNWTLGLFLDNAFDTQYDLTRNFFIPNANIADPGRPRSFGARVTANF